jgi:hypothetical protein
MRSTMKRREKKRRKRCIPRSKVLSNRENDNREGSIMGRVFLLMNERSKGRLSIDHQRMSSFSLRS